jgi:hypothetical protein
MKEYRFILGLATSLFSGAWLIYLVLLPLPIRSVRRGEVAFAAMFFCVGIGVMLLDTLTRNHFHEQLEDEQTSLQDEILAMLPDARVTREELSLYISETLGSVGFLGLDLDQLERIKVHLQRKIDERHEDS